MPSVVMLCGRPSGLTRLYALARPTHQDHGDDTLKQLIADSPWPWLGANVVDAASGDVFDGAVATHTIALPAVDGSAGTQLGLFGVCTEYTPQLSYPSDRTRFLPAVDTAVQCVDTLSDGGCGLVVGLTHVSIAQDVAIAKACDGRLTAVLGGHDHTPFAQLEAASTLVLKSGQNATWLAVVDVDVDCDPVSGAPLRLPTLAWSMVPVVGYAPDPAVAATLRTHLADLDKATSVDGVPSSTPLCTLKGVLDTRSATVRHRHAFVGTLIANAMRDHLAADVAVRTCARVVGVFPGLLTIASVAWCAVSSSTAASSVATACWTAAPWSRRKTWLWSCRSRKKRW